MYQTQFGLHGRPFRGIPGSESYYPATTHEQALSQLHQAIQDDEGLLLLTGEPGTGKTTVCLRLLERLGTENTIVFITNSHFAQRIDLLQAILFDLSLPYQDHSEQELRLTLTDFLVKNYEGGKRAVLIIDEAQHLTADVLEELRLLGNLEGDHGKAIQVVLVALPAILETLKRPELAAFSQRLGIRTHLDPLDLHESGDYLVHHLRLAGGIAKRIVSDEAFEVIARGSRGIPRLLNRAADRALELTAAAGENLLDVEAAMEALALLGLADEEEPVSDAQECLCADEEEDASHSLAQEKEIGAAGWGEKKENGADPGKDVGRARRLFAPPRRPA